MDMQKGKDDYICLMSLLDKTGMSEKNIRIFDELNQYGCREDQIKMLKKHRYSLLDDIHMRQQDLDCLDYIIHKMKNDLKEG